MTDSDTSSSSSTIGSSAANPADDVRDVIIVGSGPAGYTAAVYTARANLRPLVFEGAVSAGGALDDHHRGRELPGLPRRHPGPDLMDACASRRSASAPS